MSSDVRLRTALADDHDAVVGCVNAAYAHWVPTIGKKPAPMLADYAQLIDDGLVRVATIDGSIVGVIVMWPEDDHLYVDNVAVLPESQGFGIGKILLDAAEYHARELGLAEIHLYTNEKMATNLTYYPRRGYIETHRAEAEGYQRVYFIRQLT